VRAVTEAGPRQVSARAVVLAIGKRGTPRKLPIAVPTPWLDRVHYALADARSFAGESVLIVGLGDVAMETAVALCRQPDTRVEIAYRGTGFRRGKSRNVSEIERLVAAGRLRLHWSSEVEAFTGQGVALRTGGGTQHCAIDAVFVMIGSIVPWAFLEAVGVQRVSAPQAHPTQVALPGSAMNAQYTQWSAGALERRS
jgi:thioredoxin reductase